MYINKQKTAMTGFNPNSIQNFINVKMTFKNIFHNLIHVNFTIFFLQMSVQISNISKPQLWLVLKVESAECPELLVLYK